MDNNDDKEKPDLPAVTEAIEQKAGEPEPKPESAIPRSEKPEPELAKLKPKSEPQQKPESAQSKPKPQSKPEPKPEPAKPVSKPEKPEPASAKPESSEPASVKAGSGSKETPETPVAAAPPAQPPVEKKPKEPKEPKEPKKPRKSGSWFLVLLLLLALGGLGAAGYWIYSQQGQYSGLEAALNQQQETVGQFQRQLEEERELRLRASLAQEQITTELQLRVNAQSGRLRELSTTTRDDWLLAEAEYLIRLANQRLVTERSTKNATALLETADQILRDLDDVDLFPVRKTLATDITALRLAASVDREGLYLRLNAISEQVANLPLLSANPVGEREPVDSDDLVPAEDSWRETLVNSFHNMWAQLSTLVRVQRRDGEIEPLLPPSEEQYVRHNLRIMLEQAQLSMLREEPEVYRASLLKAKNWLTRYFELNEQSDALVYQVEKVAAQPVVQVLPDISGSLEGLRVFIDSWHKRHTVEKPAGAPRENSAEMESAP